MRAARAAIPLTTTGKVSDVAKCGCSGNSCSCKIVAGFGVRVSGTGTLNNPYRLDAYPMSVVAVDTPTVNLTITGSGLPGDPLVLSADVSAAGFSSKWTRWSGSKASFDALGSWDASTLYAVV